MSAEVQVENVSKRFGKVAALKAITLTIAPGERVALIGSNGSGKTTLMRSLLGVLRFDGRIRIGGHDVARDPMQALQNVAYVPQVAPPMDVPVGELLRTWSKLRGVAESEVAERARELGLDVIGERKKRFVDLSGGMKQKLLVSFALASAAPVLVCDEPTANLDPQARVSFFSQVGARPCGHSVILCSHRLDEVRQLVDRVVELRDGEIFHDGTISQLFHELRAYRVEVWIKENAQAAASFLIGRGFAAAGRDRFAVMLTQGEKLAIIADLLRLHAASLRDLSVYQVDTAQIESSPTKRLRVVP